MSLEDNIAQTACPICYNPEEGEDYCGHKGRGQICTREEGHPGPHYACGDSWQQHPITSWERET